MSCELLCLDQHSFPVYTFPVVNRTALHFSQYSDLCLKEIILWYYFAVSGSLFVHNPELRYYFILSLMGKGYHAVMLKKAKSFSKNPQWSHKSGDQPPAGGFYKSLHLRGEEITAAGGHWGPEGLRSPPLLLYQHPHLRSAQGASCSWSPFKTPSSNVGPSWKQGAVSLYSTLRKRDTKVKPGGNSVPRICHFCMYKRNENTF